MPKLKALWPPWPPTNPSSPTTTTKRPCRQPHISSGIPCSCGKNETYGGLGSVGVIPTFLKAKIFEMANEKTIKDGTAPADQEKAMAILAACEEYLAALLLSGANRDQFNELRNDLQNQYGYGEDRYPKTTDACISLLNCLKVSTTPQPRTPHTATPSNPEEDAALVFAQDATKSGGQRRTS